jgi:hypothetical protein
MGFYYADVEEMGASFLAVANDDPALARRAAQWLARRAWDRRHEFAAQLPSPSDAVRLAAQSKRTPVVLMDVGDNVGGGSPGDSTGCSPRSCGRCHECPVSLLCSDRAGRVDTGVRGSVRIHSLSNGWDRNHNRTAGQLETQIRHGSWTYSDKGITTVVTESGSTHCSPAPHGNRCVWNDPEPGVHRGSES